MPLIIAENRNTEGDGYLLEGNDDIAVEAGITVTSTAASGIATWAGAHVFTINGTVRAYDDGVKMLGTTETCTVVVSETGVIDAFGSSDPEHQSNGVVLDGIHSTLSNAGQISGAYAALTGIINGNVVLVNSGRMTGGVYGINAPFGLGSLILNNTGTLSAATAIYGAAGMDAITNSGSITGDIVLRDGDDSLQNTGSISGMINLGLGNDSFTDAAMTVSNHDSVLGGQGSDTIHGGLGNDTLLGGTWHDLVTGGAGADRLEGGAGADTLRGEDDTDVILAGDGHDQAYGGAGDDLVEGLDGRDRLYGDAGADTLRGGAEDDRLYGGTEGDLLEGGAGIDTLDGGAGNDTLLSGTGNDFVYGGDGDDLLQDGSPASGDDRMRGGFGRDSLIAGAGQDTLFGEEDDDLLRGALGQDELFGGNGNDTLRGGDGDDLLQGGRGLDRLDGGEGADQFIFTRPGDRGDVIRDFNASDDRLVFEGSAFGYGDQTGRVSLDDCVFDRAQEANDHWVYDRASQTLFFDSNGDAAGGRVAMATFTDANGMEDWSLWLI